MITLFPNKERERFEVRSQYCTWIWVSELIFLIGKSQKISLYLCRTKEFFLSIPLCDTIKYLKSYRQSDVHINIL